MLQTSEKTVLDYFEKLDPGRRKAISAVRNIILKHLPHGYEETMQYGMICYVVPLEVFPDTYNGMPLTLACLASQKKYMSLYLMNVYGNKNLEGWFKKEWKKTGKKLDMGKSCIRFKTLDDLPLELIGKTIAKTPVEEFVEMYKKAKGMQ